MSHVDIELAKKLKKAGLKWEPKQGDWFALKRSGAVGIVHLAEDWSSSNLDGYIWLPRLDQLLTEIRQRGWAWILYADNDGIEIKTYNNAVPAHLRHRFIDADNPINAAGEALLWILEQEKVGVIHD